MTKQEEAIDLINKMCGCFKCVESECNYDCDVCEYGTGFKETIEALDISIECIEKQIPKKPKGDFHSVPHHRCPTCNCAIRLYEKDSHDLFCKFCGQAIDWSDNE